MRPEGVSPSNPRCSKWRRVGSTRETMVGRTLCSPSSGRSSCMAASASTGCGTCRLTAATATRSRSKRCESDFFLNTSCLKPRLRPAAKRVPRPSQPASRPVRPRSVLRRPSRCSPSSGLFSRTTGAPSGLSVRRPCRLGRSSRDRLRRSRRAQLIKAGLKRWELGEAASLIGQLFYAHYLRSGDAHNLTQAYIFYSAIRARGYFNDVGEDFGRSAKRLRYYTRYIVVALVMNKREVRPGAPRQVERGVARGFAFCSPC